MINVEIDTSKMGSNYLPHPIFRCSAQICLLGVGTATADHTCAGATNTMGSAAAVSANADTTEVSSTDAGAIPAGFIYNFELVQRAINSSHTLP